MPGRLRTGCKVCACTCRERAQLPIADSGIIREGQRGADEHADGCAQVPMAGVESVFLTGTTLKMVGMDDMGDNLLTKAIAKEVRAQRRRAMQYTLHAVHGLMDAQAIAKRVAVVSHVSLISLPAAL